jgi:hypothetical protein
MRKSFEKSEKYFFMVKIMLKLENQEQVPAIVRPESVLVFSE